MGDTVLSLMILFINALWFSSIYRQFICGAEYLIYKHLIIFNLITCQSYASKQSNHSLILSKILIVFGQISTLYSCIFKTS